MALLIERVVERVCEQSWTQLRHVLRQLQATEFHTSSHVFFQRNQPTEVLVKLLKKLDIPLPATILSVNPLQSPAQNTLGTRLFSTQPWHPLSEVPSRLHAYLATRNPGLIVTSIPQFLRQRAKCSSGAGLSF